MAICAAKVGNAQEKPAILLESGDYLKRDARAGRCLRPETPRRFHAMPRYDLHCHSTYSDGLLPPAAVVARAAQRGVDVLALTDHDVVDGLPEALVAARDAGIVLVCGSELSVTWRDNTIHVIALRIDPHNATLLEGLASNRGGRGERARLMAEGLAAAGISGAYEGAMRYVTNVELVSRTHFARYLIDAGHA
jgi:predicted metal-dependent phosphoesterase TrpH